MRAKEFINEIDYTAGIEDLQISFDELVLGASLIGDMDGRDVFCFNDGEFQTYFTKSTSIDGLIILRDDHLRAVKNYSGTKGLITMLVGFVTHGLQRPIIISSNEPLTNDGINWLCSLIQSNGAGLTITNQNGDSLDPVALRAEWNAAMTDVTHGPTSIVIESRMTRKFRNKQELGPMPMTWFIGRDTL